MPVQTQILTRRGTAASWTSTNPTLGAGEIGYETDTGRFKIGTGAAAWASLGYFNRDPVTTKGDLYTFSTTDDRLPVGANGETLVADSSTSTGLRYQANFAAGKNKIINGDFGVWQRGTSFTTSSAYSADRWLWDWAGTGTTTVTRQSFTPGSAPVAGYESSFFFQIALGTGASYMSASQRIEDVRTLAGQTVTFSFWARSTSSITFLPYFRQSFGSGGSADVDTIGSGITFTSSWARYTSTVTLPSIAGKTIGTGSYLQPIFVGNSGTFASNTVSIWGVQLEAGSVATAFQTATGTIQGELAACQRYYWRQTAVNANERAGYGSFASSTVFQAQFNFPVTMRAQTGQVEIVGVSINDTASVIAVTGGGVNVNSPFQGNLSLTVASGGTQFRYGAVTLNTASSSYIGFSAEL